MLASQCHSVQLNTYEHLMTGLDEAAVDALDLFRRLTAP